MAFTAAEETQIRALLARMSKLADSDDWQRAGADLVTLKNTGEQIVVQVNALVTQATALATKFPAAAPEINAAKAAFVAALKTALGLQE